MINVPNLRTAAARDHQGKAMGDVPPYQLTTLEAHATFQELCPAAHALPAPPAFNFGTWPGELARFYYGRTRLGAAGIFVAHGMEVGAGLLLRAEARMVEAGPLNWQVSHIEQALRRHGLPDPAIEARVLPGTCALVVTPGYPIFGHWLAEILPRLGMLDAAGFDLDALTYLVPADTPAFGLELLQLFGIGPERLVELDATRAVRPDTLLLPSFPHNGRQFMALMAHAAQVLRRRVEARFGPLSDRGTPPSILLSRHGWGARRMANRPEFEALATRRGFQVVAPETMPMLDQLRLFGGAREILGEYGSALHGSLFAGPGTVVCALRGVQPHPAFLQSGIGDALDQPTGYVFGQSSADPEKRGFSVNPEDLAACLDTVFPSTRPRRPGAAPRRVAVGGPADEHAAPAQGGPGDPAAVLEAIDGALSAGALEEAGRLGQRLLQLAPRAPGLADALIRIHLASGSREEALRVAVSAVDRDPSDPAARAALVALLPAGQARPAEVGLGDTVCLDFTEAGDARRWIGCGWSQQEARHTWMINERSELVLPALSAELDWQGVFDLSPMTPQARLHILYDGHELKRLQMGRPGRVGFRIPREVIAACGRGVLGLEHPDCVSPRELGRNRDPRRLAFAARTLVLTPDSGLLQD